MATIPDYYAVLGVLPSDDAATIRAAWMALLRRTHPDTHPDLGAAPAQAINEAYAVLGKPASRAAYDRRRATPPPSSPPPPGGRPPHRPPPPPGTFRPRTDGPARRPGPAARPGPTLAEPPGGGRWLTGFFLLLLTAAPFGMIVALQNEESGYAVRASGAVLPENVRQPSAADATGPVFTPGTDAPALDPVALDTAVLEAQQTLARQGLAAARARSVRCGAAANGWAAVDFCAAFDQAVILSQDVRPDGSADDRYFAQTADRDIARYATLGLDETVLRRRLAEIHDRVFATLLRARPAL